MASVTRGKLLTVDEAAAALTLSVRTVWRLVESGALPSVRLAGRVTRFAESDVDTLIERCRHKGQDDSIERAVADLDRMESQRRNPLCPRCLKRPRVGIDMCGVCSVEVAELKEEREERDRVHKRNTWARHGAEYKERARMKAEEEK